MIPARLVRAVDLSNAVSIVFAAGNVHLDCDGGPSVVCINSNQGNATVGAVDRNLMAQPYSSQGPGFCSSYHPLVAAPTYGVLPWGLGWIDTGALGAGTSSTAPQVAAALAILRSVYPAATNVELRAALAVSAVQPGGRASLGWGPTLGYGLLRIDRALKALPAIKEHPFYSQLQAAAERPLASDIVSERVKG